MTIDKALNGLGLADYTHVVVRRRTDTNNGIEYLGGNFVQEILSRYGNLEISYTQVNESKLIIYVK